MKTSYARAPIKLKAKVAEQYQEQWFVVKQKYDIQETETVQIVKILVDLGDKLQSNICKAADSYKIHMYKEIQENLEHVCTIKKNTWVDLVSLYRRKKYGLITEKSLQKLRKGLNNAAYTIAFKKVHIQNMNEQLQPSQVKMPIVNESADININAFEYSQDSEEFLEKLDKAAETQHEIQQMYADMQSLKEAFTHLTKRHYSDFKILVDAKHYRYGGWPSENSPPRYWAPFRKIRQLNILFDEFEYDHAKMWNRRFGINIDIDTHQHFTANIHSTDAHRWEDIDLYKIPTEAYKENEHEFQQLGIKTWHVLATYSTYFIAIDETTGLVNSVIPKNILEQLSDIFLHNYIGLTTTLKEFDINIEITPSDSLTSEQLEIVNGLKSLLIIN